MWSGGWMVNVLASHHGGKGFTSFLWHHGHALRPKSGYMHMGGLQGPTCLKEFYKWPMCMWIKVRTCLRGGGGGDSPSSFGLHVLHPYEY
jgi:hypothetical protein